MNLYRLTQDDANGYDTYDSCVVCAIDEEHAKAISPSGGFSKDTYRSWAISPDLVKAELLGTAVDGMKPGVICASFNAG